MSEIAPMPYIDGPSDRITRTSGGDRVGREVTFVDLAAAHQITLSVAPNATQCAIGCTCGPQRVTQRWDEPFETLFAAYRALNHRPPLEDTMTEKLKQREGDQPLPVVNDYPDIQSAVIADIETRRQVGISRYGVALQQFNGRDTVRDAYEEAMDLTIYLRSVIAERDDVEGVAAIQQRLRHLDEVVERLVDLFTEFSRMIDGIARWEMAADGEIRAAIRPVGENMRNGITRITTVVPR